MRLTNLFTSLLVGISVTGLSIAQPFDGPGDLQERSFVLDPRGLNIKYGKEPTKDATCPDREKSGNFGPYAKHTYTKGQIKAAFVAAAKLAADGKQVGDRKYPHEFGNAEKIPFPCGKNKMEFPITTDNKIYSGGSASDIPDRVVFESRKTKKEIVVKYCGVMRHGVKKEFLECR
ncbi:hypothetical protein E4U55_002672 [Claviceps digitariae]|nr:hypothetical protein E4U55_002672 [Claviceps digitariae]